MAVDIDEVQVEVAEPQPPAKTAGPAKQPRVDLKSALEYLRERNARLKAD